MNIKNLWISILFLLSWFIGSYIYLNIISNQTVQYSIQDISNENVSIHQLENQITDTIKDVFPWIVNIIITKDLTIYKNDPFNFFRQPITNIERKIWWWSGIFITKDGIILTNNHVVNDKQAEYTVILSDAKEYKAQVLFTDSVQDLALIKINTQEDILPLEFVKDSNIQIGQFVIASWNPLSELHNSISLGIISAVNRSLEIDNTSINNLLQTDAIINPGNSGWPLIDLNGKVIWINTFIDVSSPWIWFAIPLTQKKIQELLSHIQ